MNYFTGDLLKEVKPGINPLGPENIICISPGIATGISISGFSRFTMQSKSPPTGAIADSQSGGFFGPELRFCG